MTDSKSNSSSLRVVVGLALLGVVGGAVWWFFDERGAWPRGEALVTALQPLIDQQGSDAALVARAILDNYTETRTNASRWSGIYWGFTFAAAACSATAGLLLKFETLLKDEALKKDIAAVLAVGAALLITISTSGDFQRKWQANRTAAAELERTGYELLEHKGENARAHLASVGQILLRRHMSILGGAEQRRPSTDPAKVAPAGK